MLWSASCGKTRLMQAVEPTMPVSSRDVLDDDLRWHRHPTGHMRTGDHAIAVGNSGLDFPSHPARHVELRHEDVLGALRRFTDLIIGPRPQGFDLDQPDPQPFLGQQANRLTPL